jgi:hypothetical protein
MVGSGRLVLRVEATWLSVRVELFSHARADLRQGRLLVFMGHSFLSRNTLRHTSDKGSENALEPSPILAEG